MSGLQKTLTARRGTALMLNIVLGAGLLILPGLAVKLVGDHAFIAWLSCALASVPLLAVFVLLGKRYPNAGGIPHFAAKAFGPLFYILASFIFLGAVAIGLPSIALTGGYYGASLFGNSPNFYATGLVLAALLINLLSVEISGRLNQLIAVALISFLIAIVVVALLLIEPSQSAPSVLPSMQYLEPGRVLIPFTMIFFAFTGWEVAANLSEEFQNPKRDFPIAMIVSFLIAAGLYLAMALVAQTRDLHEGYEAPFATIFGAHFGKPGKTGIALVAMTLIFANLSAALWGVSRLIFALAREAMLPSVLAIVKNGQPIAALYTVAIVLFGIIVLNYFGFFGVETLLGLSGQNFFILYGLSAAALVALASRQHERLLGIFALLIVITLSLLQGGALLYPTLLTVLAAGVHWRRRTTSRIAPDPT
jgi:amino acid efflux transporter